MTTNNGDDHGETEQEVELREAERRFNAYLARMNKRVAVAQTRIGITAAAVLLLVILWIAFNL